jgi:hypothetical protein
MSSEQFYKWKEANGKTVDNSKEMKKGDSNQSSKTGDKSSSRKKFVEMEEERKNERNDNARYLKIRKSYETAIKLATEEWMLANDGVVTGLRYNGRKQKFLAKVNYKRDGDDKEEQIVVADDWIIDMYGSHVFTKLIDRRMNDEF